MKHLQNCLKCYCCSRLLTGIYTRANQSTCGSHFNVDRDLFGTLMIVANAREVY